MLESHGWIRDWGLFCACYWQPSGFRGFPEPRMPRLSFLDSPGRTLRVWVVSGCVSEAPGGLKKRVLILRLFFGFSDGEELCCWSPHPYFLKVGDGPLFSGSFLQISSVAAGVDACRAKNGIANY